MTYDPPIAKKRWQTRSARAHEVFGVLPFKTREGQQEPSSSCEQTVYRAPGQRSVPPARSTAAPAQHAYYNLKVCSL